MEDADIKSRLMLVGSVLILAALGFVALLVFNTSSENAPVATSPPASPATLPPDPMDSPLPAEAVIEAPKPSADAVHNQTVRLAAVQKFVGMPLVRHSEWLGSEFIVAAHDNGQSWQPVADAACAWLRGQGYSGSVSVVVLEAAALSNKRWDQLARARCN